MVSLVAGQKGLFFVGAARIGQPDMQRLVQPIPDVSGIGIVQRHPRWFRRGAMETVPTRETPTNAEQNCGNCKRGLHGGSSTY